MQSEAETWKMLCQHSKTPHLPCFGHCAVEMAARGHCALEMAAPWPLCARNGCAVAGVRSKWLRCGHCALKVAVLWPLCAGNGCAVATVHSLRLCMYFIWSHCTASNCALRSFTGAVRRLCESSMYIYIYIYMYIYTHICLCTLINPPLTQPCKTPSHGHIGRGVLKNFSSH